MDFNGSSIRKFLSSVNYWSQLDYGKSYHLIQSEQRGGKVEIDGYGTWELVSTKERNLILWNGLSWLEYEYKQKA